MTLARKQHDIFINAEAAEQTAGLFTLAVYGRAVMHALEHMRRFDRQRFNAWYAPYETFMAADPLMRYFLDLRDRVLKEGPPSAGVVHIKIEQSQLPPESLPINVEIATIDLPAFPAHHAGNPILGIQEMTSDYIAYLTRLVADAEHHFASP